MKMSPTFLNDTQKIQGIDPMFHCALWSDSIVSIQKYYQNIDNKTNMNSC